jgi:hypothetical protein
VVFTATSTSQAAAEHKAVRPAFPLHLPQIPCMMVWTSISDGCQLRKVNRMECVIGIDIGHSTGNRATTGLVVLECEPLHVRVAKPVTRERVLREIQDHLGEGDIVAVAVIDGPLALPAVLPTQRLCEQFFATGAFASTGGTSKHLRLQPAPTKRGSAFHRAATEVADALMASPYHLPKFQLHGAVQPSVIEIFPTLFMAAMLPPTRYDGDRSAHTDTLWSDIVAEVTRGRLPMLDPYLPLMQEVDKQSSDKARHEVRAAFICAIAAHAVRSGVSQGFLGSSAEQGFLLPGTRDGRGWMNDDFRDLLHDAWERRPHSGAHLSWL